MEKLNLKNVFNYKYNPALIQTGCHKWENWKDRVKKEFVLYPLSCYKTFKFIWKENACYNRAVVVTDKKKNGVKISIELIVI